MSAVSVVAASSAGVIGLTTENELTVLTCQGPEEFAHG
jgi:hypothetical protein